MRWVALAASTIGLAAWLTVCLASRRARQAVAGGALWGSVLGVWLLAPRLVGVHHVVLDSIQSWALLSVCLVGLFAVLGAGLAAVVAVPLGVLDLRRSTRGDVRPIAVHAWVGAMLPLLYLAASGVIEWTNFARPPGPQRFAAAAIQVSGFSVLLFGAIRWIDRLPVARSGGAARAGRRLLLGLIAAGVAALPLSTSTAVASRTSTAPLERRDGATPPPLLVIGFDGGNWRTLMPLIENNATPTLARIFSTGIQGEVEALWKPYWSTPAWGAMLTGYPREEIGVHEDLAATAPGLPMFELPLTLDPLLNPLFALEFQLIRVGAIEVMHVPRGRLKRQPIWERLSASGVRTAVVKFPFTYPATGQADYVVSNYVVTDLWDMAGVRSHTAPSVVHAPPGTADLRAWFTGPEDADAAAMALLFPFGLPPRPHDAVVDPIAVLRRVLGNSQRMFGVTNQIIRHDPDVDVVMFYLSSFDNIAHAFWQYRFPDEVSGDRPSAADIEALGPVIGRYLEYLDAQLAHLIAAFPREPNILIVADHGQEASEDYPLWKGWHSRFGVFLAAGPSIARRPEPLAVSYYDIAPTMLDLLGFAPADDLRGRSLLAR